MATNPPSGDGHRNGAVRNRSQVFNPKTQTWVKRDSDTGRFMYLYGFAKKILALAVKNTGTSFVFLARLSVSLQYDKQKTTNPHHLFT